MATKSPITCHVLDSSIGKPAQGVKVQLLQGPIGTNQLGPSPSPSHGGTWVEIGTSVTNADGRCLDLLLPLPPGPGQPESSSSRTLQSGTYQIVFETKEYFEKMGRKSFYPFVQITFAIENPSEHYHVPLLLSPFSYTTYRGS